MLKMVKNVPPRSIFFDFTPPDEKALRIEVQRVDRNHILLQMGPHGHRFLEVMYFEKGGGWHRLGTHTKEIEAGDLFAISRGEIHDASGIEAAEGWVVLFTADVLKPSSPQIGSYLHWLSDPLFLPFLRPRGIKTGYFNIPPIERVSWSQRLQELKTELSAKRLGYEAVARAYLTQILVEAARLTEQTLNQIPLQEQPLLAEVFQVIETRYMEPISLADVAKAVARSPAYLTTMSRQLTGHTILEWIVERRMAEARRLLLETDEDINRIGEQIGYRDSPYFIRQFRQVHGSPPQTWRRSHR